MKIKSTKEIFLDQKMKSLEIRSSNCSDRIKKLRLLLNWILKNRSNIQEALFKDLGKSPEESDITEVYTLTAELRYIIENLSVWMSPKKVSTPLTMIGSSSFIFPESKGVCLIIAPWNYPFSLIIGPLISAISGGNTAMLKPSEITPNVAALIENMIEELFAPNEVAVINGDENTAKELLLLPFNHIFFTGSPAIGKVVMTAAAQHLASITLELGGKSPAVVNACADINDAAKKIVWGKFINAGQTCIAPDYVLVHVNVFDDFMKHLIMHLNKMFDEDAKGIQSSKNYSRIVNEHHFDRLLNLLNDAKSKGAEITFGGNTDKLKKYFEPTIITKIPDCNLMEEEIFGPLLPVLTFSKEEEVIDYINKKSKPLSMYIFAKTKSFSNSLLEKTSAGGVCINDCLIHYSHPELPFGGINNSGIGKSHGHFGFEEFTNKKAIVKQRTGFSMTQILYPPYSKFSKKVIDFLIKYF